MSPFIETASPPPRAGELVQPATESVGTTVIRGIGFNAIGEVDAQQEPNYILEKAVLPQCPTIQDMYAKLASQVIFRGQKKEKDPILVLRLSKNDTATLAASLDTAEGVRNVSILELTGSHVHTSADIGQMHHSFEGITSHGDSVLIAILQGKNNAMPVGTISVFRPMPASE